MKGSKTKIWISITVIVAFTILLMFTFASAGRRISGGHEWGHGNTREEACANAKALIRMKCENPIMGECECNTFHPKYRWSCNVSFSCK